MNENILAENMRRFGTKNLNEQETQILYPTDKHLNYLKQNKRGTIQTVNGKPTYINKMPAPDYLSKNSIKQWKNAFGEVLPIPTGTTIWNYNLTNDSKRLQLIDPTRQYMAYIKLRD
jgi:hypothetical protein